MEDPTLTRKFGPPPSPLPPAAVALVQFLVCAVVLVVVHPPFVRDADGDVSVRLVAVVAGGTVAAASACYATNHSPLSVATRVVTSVYRHATSS